MKSRREESVWKRFKRRIRSSRAAAFLEFAMVAPLLVMVISAMIEFTQLWDAKIMANHTAWTIGRIATVRGTQAQNWRISSALPSGIPVVSDFNDMRALSTVLMMSTCTMGSWGTFSQDASDFLKKLIQGPIDALKKAIADMIAGKLKELIGKFILPDIASGILDGLLKLINDAISRVLDALMQPIARLIESLCQTIFGPIDKWLLYDSPRQVRQIIGAGRRWVKFDGIVKLDNGGGTPWEFTKKPQGFMAPNDTSLSYPRCLDNKSEFDDESGFVTKDSGWPANSQSERMIRVTVNWPFERTWLFPVVSGHVRKGETVDAVRAVGHSLVFPQPGIELKHLLSEGAAKYDEGANTNKYADIISQLQNEIQGFMKLVAFGMDYRRIAETVCAYDSCSAINRSYKAIGHGGERNNDGLVFWMGRAPRDPKNYYQWDEGQYKKWDYLKSWDTLTVDDGTHHHETDLFSMFGVERPLHKHLNSAEWRHGRDWFYWGPWNICPDVHQRYRRELGWAKDAIQPSVYFWLLGDDRPSYGGAGYCFGWCLCSPQDTGWGTLWFPTLPQYERAVRRVQSEVPELAAISPVEYFRFGRYFDSAPFRRKLEDWITVYRPDDAAGMITREKAMAKNIEICSMMVPHIKEFLRKEAEELRRQVSGEVQDGVDGKLDWGVDEEMILKDPTKAEQIIRQKFDNMKRESFEVLRQIDDQIKTLSQVDDETHRVVNEVCLERHSELLRFGGAIGLVPNIYPESYDKETLLARLRNAGSPYAQYKYLDGLVRLEQAMTSLTNAVETSRQLEIKYGTIFQLGEAKREGHKKIDDIDPGGSKEEPVDPLEPPPSSGEPGCDDDRAGDKWKYDDSKKQWVIE